MADLNSLSDEELDRRIAEKLAPKPKDLSSLSDEELDARIQSKMEGPSLGERALSGVAAVGETVDKYTGAPTRSALSELIRTDREFGKEPPSVLGNIASAGKAFISQFGEDPNLAPTGKDIATKRLGLSEQSMVKDIPVYKFATELTQKQRSELEAAGVKPDIHGRYQIGKQDSFSPAGVVGFGIDVSADPTNVIPASLIAKGVSKAGIGTAKAAAKGISRAADVLPGVKGSKEAISKIYADFVNPKQALDFKDLANIADKHAIDLSNAPEAVEFGKTNVISRLGRSQAEGPGGQARLDRHRQFTSDVSQAIDRTAQNISGGTQPFSRIDAGAHLSDAYDRSLDRLFKEADFGYSQVVSEYPGLILSKVASQNLKSKLAGIEKFAKGRISRGLSPEHTAQGKMLLNAVNAIRRTNGSVKQAVEVLRDVGDIAYKKRALIGQIPPDIEKTRDLYTTLKEAIHDTVRTEVKDGVAMEGALRISNDKMSKFFEQSKFLDETLSNPKLAPEQVFDRLTKNSSQIEAMKELLDPGDLAKIKGAFIESLIKRDEFGNIRFAPLKSAMENRQNRSVIEKLYEPEELKELTDLIKLGERADTAVLSTSGTGASNVFKDIGKGIEQSIFNESVLDVMKSRARIPSPPPPQLGPPRPGAPSFGPRSIGASDVFGLRLPQQISIQKRNRDKERNP